MHNIFTIHQFVDGSRFTYRAIIGNTALHFCAYNHDKAAITRLLLKNGAIEVKSFDEHSPLDLAISYRHPRTVSALVTRYSPQRRIDALLLYGAWHDLDRPFHDLDVKTPKTYWRRALREAEQLEAKRNCTNKKKNMKNSVSANASKGLDADEELADHQVLQPPLAENGYAVEARTVAEVDMLSADDVCVMSLLILERLSSYKYIRIWEHVVNRADVFLNQGNVARYLAMRMRAFELQRLDPDFVAFDVSDVIDAFISCISANCSSLSKVGLFCL